jgi:tRNA(Glu) U13 pseudouridine synthase TruD
MIIKASPEDFTVEEVLDAKSLIGEGSFSLYLLSKRLWNTEDCIQWLARALGRPRKDFGVCGNKDRNAVTKQYITIRNGSKEIRTPSEDTEEGTRFFSLEYLGATKEGLYLGAHEKNRFTIVVRGLEGLEGTSPKVKPFNNYFGEQRFSDQNAIVGMLLVKKQYKEAAALLKLEAGTDAVGALRKLPRSTLVFYIHAAQSALWNELADSASAPADENNTSVPMPGFSPEGSDEQLALLDALLTKHGLDRMSFVNRSMPELTVEGGSRKLLQDVSEFSATEVKDGVCTLSFTLGKGQYATETVKQLFS